MKIIDVHHLRCEGTERQLDQALIIKVVPVDFGKTLLRFVIIRGLERGEKGPHKITNLEQFEKSIFFHISMNFVQQNIGRTWQSEK